MQRATGIVRKPAVKADKIIDSVILHHQVRQAHSALLQGEKGTVVSLALEKPGMLNDGDALKLDDGSLILVKAALEPLIEIKAENPARLLRAAFSFGSNHVPCEITADALYVLADPASAEMARGLGCMVTDVSRAFEPERSAHHHHHHHHDHAHDHHHEHGAGCGCGHHYDHEHHHDHNHDHHDHGHHHHK